MGKPGPDQLRMASTIAPPASGRRKRTANWGRLIHCRVVRHAARMAGLDTVDIYGELSDGVAGDEQVKLLFAGKAVELGELLRLQAEAIPAKSGVGLYSLLGQRLAQGDGGPGGIIEGGDRPTGGRLRFENAMGRRGPGCREN